MKTVALTVSGIIYVIVAIAHFYRFHKAMPITLGDYSVSMNLSLYAGIVAVILAIWMFVAAKSDR